jgi:K+-transporting ATPase KdpF subunit
MNAESWIALIGAAAVMAYLVYTLIQPEKF